jgi:ribonuclease Z
MEELEAEARLHYSGQLFLASDFDIYELDARGHLQQQLRSRKPHLGN